MADLKISQGTCNREEKMWSQVTAPMAIDGLFYVLFFSGVLSTMIPKGAFPTKISSPLQCLFFPIPEVLKSCPSDYRKSIKFHKVIVSVCVCLSPIKSPLLQLKSLCILLNMYLTAPGFLTQ